MKTFAYNFQYVDRKYGPLAQAGIKQSGSSLRVATGRAIKTFFRDKTRKQMRDIQTSGLKISIIYVGEQIS